MQADQRRHVRNVGKVLAEKALEKVGDHDRAEPRMADVVGQVLEERLDGRHCQRRARPMPLDVSNHVKALAGAERNDLVHVAADDFLRLRPGGIEHPVVQMGTHRQHASLDVRREHERLPRLLHLPLDEPLDAA